MIEIISVRFDEEGTCTIDWFDKQQAMREKVPEYHSTVITASAQAEMPHVGTYVSEIVEDALEALNWVVRYRRGEVV